MSIIPGYRNYSLRTISNIPEDMEATFLWANDPDARANSINSDPITWTTHRSWFRKRVRNKLGMWLFLEEDGVPIGQIRFDPMILKTPSFEKYGVFNLASVFIAKEHRGLGLGTEIIKTGTMLMEGGSHIGKTAALVKKENAASCRVFEKAGYEVVKGYKHIEYVLLAHPLSRIP